MLLPEQSISRYFQNHKPQGRNKNVENVANVKKNYIITSN